ncbi:multidrug resistance protein, putative [Entamoeba dispar SAW760]|uniref:ABC-type xenobiotic transporter n=1 Tax=Entamoeba dispar (strain ATCC PRA-260 / SAW760) TaxID=370354 RepID=B0E5K6_ENTDS|nr:multidrug resistance protein, putative [Entamoeba dispar SAW760]EDR30175.1 multidrug resistance protein, putative [Entamoeba dispar SAW760]|eukprot:EDR30175.1 multidrug resistance protein, putative [Entamoeba dispar SAW760]
MTSEPLNTFNIFNVNPDPNEILSKKKLHDTEGKVNLIKLFKYSDWIDLILLIIGIISSIGNGILQPVMLLLMGDVIDSYIYTSEYNIIIDEEVNHMIVEGVKESVNKVVVKMVYFGVISMVLSFMRTFSLFVVSQREGIRVRKLYFKSLLRQDATWYDFQESGELTTRIATDIKNFQDGIGPKFGMIFQIFSMTITGYIIGFIKSWDLALVVLATVLLSCFSFTGFEMVAMKYETKALSVFGVAGSIAEETIGNIRTVQSLNQEHKFSEEYEEKIKENEHFNAIKGQCFGIGFGFSIFFIFCSYALGNWYGSIVIRGKGGSKGVIAGDILGVFFSVLIGSQTLAMVATPLNLLFSAQTSAYKIFTTIDRIPDIDCQSTVGECPNECNGNIKFEDVQFVYPTRPSHQVLKGLNLEIKKGETIALVGVSGCGKSTTIQLIQRNYDPNSGKITIDGKDIRELNIKWLRNQIGIVGQEPILFAGTIRENIILGTREGETLNEEEMIKCAKMANAHDFISKLPDGYDTIIGEKGALLSGGQKQRIAIARALIRKPSILLLDEATSALDSESEKIVQEAIDKASKGRTTIIIAHRLSTIQNADKICVIMRGKIVEQGTHQELIELKGFIIHLLCNNLEQ